MIAAALIALGRLAAVFTLKGYRCLGNDGAAGVGDGAGEIAGDHRLRE